jgi:transposase-like protein
MKAFKSIIDFQAHFNNDEKCRQELEQERWGDTPYCPFCASINVCRFSTGKLFKCREKECRQKFTVTVGTIYESSKIPLTKWFLAQYLLTIHSKGISSLQLANFLGITQKSAWYLTHRIRESFKVLAPEQLENIVEFDETYIGGSLSNKHKSKRTAKGGTTHKEMVFGALQRGGKLITKVIPQTEIYQIGETIEQILAPDSTMVTDEHPRIQENRIKIQPQAY